MSKIPIILVCILAIGFIFVLSALQDQKPYQNQEKVELKPEQGKYKPDKEFTVPETHKPSGLPSLQTPAFQPSFSNSYQNADLAYTNRHVASRDIHPVLAYQMMHDKGINPANYGDPLRIPDVAGPLDPGYPGVSTYVDGLRGIPIPMGALKRTSEKYNKNMFRFPPAFVGTGTSAFLPPGSDIPAMSGPSPADYYRPYGPNSSMSGTPFFGNVNAYAPFPEITTAWEKAGLLTSTGDKNVILNLYRRPIAPVQDLWEYQVQDKDGFLIKLENRRYIEDGDIIHHVIGKEKMGPWRAHVFVQNKYIWV